mmetsp:Transcript_373/g.1348  ORF Transcript_373/g.1348 Transcript_373/m.1348 type:complete len:278 (-) Transcript_373:47-880(-)
MRAANVAVRQAGRRQRRLGGSRSSRGSRRCRARSLGVRRAHRRRSRSVGDRRGRRGNDRRDLRPSRRASRRVAVREPRRALRKAPGVSGHQGPRRVQADVRVRTPGGSRGGDASRRETRGRKVGTRGRGRRRGRGWTRRRGPRRALARVLVRVQIREADAGADAERLRRGQVTDRFPEYTRHGRPRAVRRLEAGVPGQGTRGCAAKKPEHILPAREEHEVCGTLGPRGEHRTGGRGEPGFDDCRGAAGAGGEGQREGGRRGRIKLVCRVAKQNKSRS